MVRRALLLPAFSLSLLGDLKRCPREAVISDKRWVRVLSGIAGPLVPHVELKVFGTSEREAAMTWVSGANES